MRQQDLSPEELEIVLKHGEDKARIIVEEEADKKVGWLKNEHGMYYRLDRPGEYYINNCDGTFKSWGPAPDGKNQFFD